MSALVERCNTRMLQDTCGVMTASVPTQPAARLFIAGVGEVDGEAFERLRRQGDVMCREVGQQCRSDRAGAACRIALALYPDASR